MHGNAEIIQALNQLLAGELSAIDVYFVQSRILEKQGLTRLHERLSGEIEDETRHADLLIKRILFLGGLPDVASRAACAVGATAEEMLNIDLELELAVAAHLNETIALCDSVGDHGTRKILERLLEETENDHISWLEAQLHLIGDVGIQNYLQGQI